MTPDQQAAAVTAPDDRRPSNSDLALLAAEHGLAKVGIRPSLPAYVRSLWERRSFLWVMARSRAYNRNQNNYLGQLWTILSPLTLAGVYFLVFGVLLDTRGGVDNYPAFLTIGIFIFQSIAATITSGSTSISSNLSVVRALRFPRVALPLAVAISEMLTLLPAMGVMIVIVLLTGGSVAWSWLLLPVALVLILLFGAGCAMIAARLVVAARDLRNLIPVAIRMLRYVSGVFFSIQHYASGVLGMVLEYQPVAVYLSLVRSCMLDEFPVEGRLWLAGLAWAVAFLLIGFVVFWGAEERYGRD